MKWLIAFASLFSIATAEVAAQEVNAAVLASATSLSAAFPAPHPQPQRQEIRDDDVHGTWELGLGYTYVRFRSSLSSASMNGLNTSVSYYLRDHLALEGSVTSAFGAPSADASYLFYGAGLRVSKGNPKLQPFAHALVGGTHIFPRGATGNNGFAVQLGGGAETRLQPRLWLRIEGDYVRSQLYSSGQNNFQAVVSVNYRF
jgi:hypothetical protein